MGTSFFGIINPNVRELATQMSARYKDALKAEPDPWARTVSGFSSTDELRLKFPIDLTNLGPGFRKWIGPRDFKDQDVEAFFIDSEPFERSVTVPLKVATSPGFGAYVNQVGGLVSAARAHWNLLIANILQNGKVASANTWDKVPLFSANHPVNFRDASKGVFANVYTNKPFNRANFGFAKKAFRSIKAPDGKIGAGLRLTHVLAPTDLEETIDSLFMKTTLINDGGTAADTNIYYAGAQKIIASELDNEPGVWYGLGLNLPARPFETQASGGGDPDIQFFGDGTEWSKINGKVAWMADMFGASGPAHPHTIIRFEPS
jgi:phage major head subunit gpT-like protein